MNESLYISEALALNCWYPVCLYYGSKCYWAFESIVPIRPALNDVRRGASKWCADDVPKWCAKWCADCSGRETGKRSLKDVVRCVARCDRWFICIYVQIYIKEIWCADDVPTALAERFAGGVVDEEVRHVPWLQEWAALFQAELRTIGSMQAAPNRERHRCLGHCLLVELQTTQTANM